MPEQRHMPTWWMHICAGAPVVTVGPTAPTTSTNANPLRARMGLRAPTPPMMAESQRTRTLAPVRLARTAPTAKATSTSVRQLRACTGLHDGVNEHTCACEGGWEGTNCAVRSTRARRQRTTTTRRLVKQRPRRLAPRRSDHQCGADAGVAGLGERRERHRHEYNGMTITTGGDVVATGVITDYDGTAKTIVVTWSACTETGTVCDDMTV